MVLAHGSIFLCDNKVAIERAPRTKRPSLGYYNLHIYQTNTKVYYLPGNMQIMADFLSRDYAPETIAADAPHTQKVAVLEPIVIKTR